LPLFAETVPELLKRRHAALSLLAQTGALLCDLAGVND